MAKRTNYVTDQIDRENSARERYNYNSTKENRDKLYEEYGRTKRALDYNAGAGRGAGDNPEARKKKNEDAANGKTRLTTDDKKYR